MYTQVKNQYDRMSLLRMVLTEPLGGPHIQGALWSHIHDGVHTDVCIDMNGGLHKRLHNDM